MNVIIVFFVILSVIAPLFGMYKSVKDDKQHKDANYTLAKVAARLLRMSPADNNEKAERMLNRFYDEYFMMSQEKDLPFKASFADMVFTAARNNEDDYAEADLADVADNKDYVICREFVHLLFCLADLHEGIRANEWNFLLGVMRQLKLKPNDIAELKREFAYRRSEYGETV